MHFLGKQKTKQKPQSYIHLLPALSAFLSGLSIAALSPIFNPSYCDFFLKFWKSLCLWLSHLTDGYQGVHVGGNSCTEKWCGYMEEILSACGTEKTQVQVLPRTSSGFLHILCPTDEFLVT